MSVITLLAAQTFGQGRLYQGPDDPAADPQAERTGVMDGNRVLLFYRNTTETSDCCGLGYDVSKWPNNFDGTKMHDGIALMIGGKVFLDQDGNVVDDPEIIKGRTDLDSLSFIQSTYREFMDKDPNGEVEWGLYPVFGYFNESISNFNETPAMSNDTLSWPEVGWPSQGDGLKWQGQWNGRFGNVMRADLECFFVANDAQDLEKLGPEDSIKYYPRPGVKIGDKAENSVQSGQPWGGLGIRVETRGFQWSNPQSTDAIFWEYNISNISDYNIPFAFFGCLVDNAVGGEEYDGDDIAYYIDDDGFNMCYSWDLDNVSAGGGKEPGVMGIAFLESPGIPFDGVDNDDDGIIDEKRDNDAGQIVDANYHIVDKYAFGSYYYNLSPEQVDAGGLDKYLGDHFEGDEDQDWTDGEDINGDGVYTADEFAGDDVGLDGKGPNDPGYDGPDADGTECNHRPDYVEGIGAEPNFATTDVSESDMLGLTSFMYDLDWTQNNDFFGLDEEWYENLTEGTFHEFQENPKNFIELFASGEFSLYKGRTERVSMSELHSYENHDVIMADEHLAPSLFRLKKVVQNIYEADYRFAQPPLTPKLTATPGDGKVILTWDDASDKNTFDPFFHENDFQGYKLYRATDYKMSDAEEVTDGFGSLFELSNPIYQCDKIDNVEGFSDWGLLNGAGFYLGANSGLKHHYIDENVENGRTYYYVICAYDTGSVATNITPTQNSYVIRTDAAEQVVQISKNAAVATPRQRAAGYIAPEIETDENAEFIGNGSISVNVIDKTLVKPEHEYRMTFDIEENFRTSTLIDRPIYERNWKMQGYIIWDMTDSTEVYFENSSKFAAGNMAHPILTTQWDFPADKEIKSEIIDGFQTTIVIPTVLPGINLEKSDWLVGEAPIEIELSTTNDFRYAPHKYFPWEYEIVFTDNDSVYQSDIYAQSIPLLTGAKKSKRYFDFQRNYSFYVQNISKYDSLGNHPKLDMLIYHDIEQDTSWDFENWDVTRDKILVGYSDYDEDKNRIEWRSTMFIMSFRNDEGLFPEVNDVYRINSDRTFSDLDTMYFSVKPEVLADEEDVKETMDSIKVVPNPYVAGNTYETAVANWQKSVDRQIMFTHIPARCKITIFTVSGAIVDEIDVENSAENQAGVWDSNDSSNGSIFWDLKNKEGLEVAPGYYVYHVKSKDTGKEKIGKFAIIK